MADGTRDLMGYGGMINEALRSVVRAALTVTARDGLPGEHHFYITFDTRTEGVVMPARLHERYPEEMTIVLQHQFSNLEVFPDRFSVMLSFDRGFERLVIPFSSVLRFVDPSVSFGLQFQVDPPAEVEEEAPEAPESDRPAASVVSLEARREAQESGASGEPARPTPLTEKRADSTSSAGPKPRSTSETRPRSPSQARTRSISEAGRRGLTDVDEAAAKLLDGEAAETSKRPASAEDAADSTDGERKSAADPDRPKTASEEGEAQEAGVDGAAAKESPAAQVVHIDAFRKR